MVDVENKSTNIFTTVSLLIVLTNTRVQELMDFMSRFKAFLDYLDLYNLSVEL